DYLVRPLSADALSGRLHFAEARLARAAARPGDAPAPGHVARLEETLHVQQVLLEGLFQSAPAAIAVVDERERIVRVNAEFTRMFGFAQEEARGRYIDDLIVPEHSSDEATSITEGVRRGERHGGDTVRRHRDGTLLEVSVLATPIDVAGGKIGSF